MANVRKLAKQLLSPNKEMEGILRILKTDYDIEPARREYNPTVKENHCKIKGK